MKWKSKDLVAYYFTKESDELYKCICGKQRKQKVCSGYSNLIGHIRVHHPNHEAEMKKNYVPSISTAISSTNETEINEEGRGGNKRKPIKLDSSKQHPKDSKKPKTSLFSFKEIAMFYFRRDMDDEYVCICGVRRKQRTQTGYSNLTSHVLSSHPNYEVEMKKKSKQSNSFKNTFHALKSSLFTSKEIASFYFTKEDGDEFRCICGIRRKQRTQTGYSNLTSHVLSSHPNYETEMRKESIIHGSLRSFNFDQPKTIQSWMDWVISMDHPYSFMNAHLQHYLNNLTKHIENNIRKELPAEFGILLNHWTHHDENYIAVFACCEQETSMKYILLTITSFYDHPNEHVSAQSHREFLEQTLMMYQRHLHEVCFLIGEDRNMLKYLATLLNVPIITCAEERFNRAIERYLSNFECIQKVSNLMLHCKSLAVLGKLRSKTLSLPQLHHKSHWTSNLEMISTYHQIKGYLYEFQDLNRMVLNMEEEKRLEQLNGELQYFEQVLNRFHHEALTLVDIQHIFDGIVQKHPFFMEFLSDGTFQRNVSPTMHDKVFEHAIIKYYKRLELTAYEEKLLSGFQRNDNTIIMLRKAIEQTRQRQQEEGNMANKKSNPNSRQKPVNIPNSNTAPLDAYELKYKFLSSLSPVTNRIQKYFQNSKFILRSHGSASIPFEKVLYIKLNSDFWNLQTLNNIKKTMKDDNVPTV